MKYLLFIGLLVSKICLAETLPTGTTFYSSSGSSATTVSAIAGSTGITVQGTGVSYTINGNLNLDAINTDFYLTVNSGCSLTITGAIVSSSTRKIYIKSSAADAIITINNGISVSGNIELWSDGTINITGNVAVTGAGNYIKINGNNKITVNGNVTLGTNSTIEMDGTLTVYGNLSAALPAANNYIQGNSKTSSIHGSVSGFGHISGSITLPIELAFFKAIKNGVSINLHWQTATEENNDYFSIERSADGVNYEIIGTIMGAGTSMSALNYSYIDNKPLNGISYYRLKQTDYDGKFEVFNPVSVSYLNESEIKIGSNPSAEELNISMSGEMGIGVAKIYNVIGVLMKTIEITDNYTTVNVSDMPKGAYILVVSANKTQITKKIMIK